ncbi:hypothetical protein ACWGR4_34635 [Embleya sp. NPDC055664]
MRIGQRALLDEGGPMAGPGALQGGEQADHAAADDHGTHHRPHIGAAAVSPTSG